MRLIPQIAFQVMVWIHGGGFVVGSASTYDGSALAAYQDVVLVVIQYRLGALGFLRYELLKPNLSIPGLHLACLM